MFASSFFYLYNKVRVGVGEKLKQNQVFYFMIYINIYHRYVLYLLIYCNKHPFYGLWKLLKLKTFSFVFNTFSHTAVVLTIRRPIIMFEFEICLSFDGGTCGKSLKHFELHILVNRIGR